MDLQGVFLYKMAFKRKKDCEKLSNQKLSSKAEK